MADLVNLLNQIAGVVGVPCVLLLSWAIWTIRDLQKRVDSLETENKRKESELDAKLGALYDKINTLSADVSFIRGALERKE